MPKRGETGMLKPFWQTTDGETVRFYLGHVTDVLARLKPASVQCCVTSPPYWGLRDYGTATWTGGSPDCVHDWGRKNAGHVGKASHDSEKYKSPFRGTVNGSAYLEQGAMSSMVCLRGCGATRTDMQLGSEPSPDCRTFGQAQCGRCFVCAMVAVFRGVRRVLRDDGTLWLNLGDSYSGGTTGRNDSGNSIKRSDGTEGEVTAKFKTTGGSSRSPVGILSGNLIGVPWRVALALQADGWVLRQDVIWSKPSPMPESVRNRCTKAHEYVFLLTKSMRYYCDMDAIREDSKPGGKMRDGFRGHPGTRYVDNNSYDNAAESVPGGGAVEVTSDRNKRSVWHVASQGYEGAHFATFPPKLITPMILAGTSERGCCAGCGAPWKRVTEEVPLERDRPNEYVKRIGVEGTGNSCANTVAGVESRTIGWEPACGCFGRFEKRTVTVPKSTARYTGGDRNSPGDAGASPRDGGDKETTETIYVSDLPLDRHPVVPCTVLDPFIGSGTTAEVCVTLDRRCVGVDLSEKYLTNNAVPRVSGELLARPATAHLVGGRKRVAP